MSATPRAALSESERRARELEVLLETAGDLSSLRDVDQVLAAIVRRSRQLLHSDVAYLMLLDDDGRQAHMRVGDGILTPEFLSIRLPIGEGIAGLVAESGMPLWTRDYLRDPHLAHRIGATVEAESLVAILGVPLAIGGRVLGVLLAADRRPRDFTHQEVALLTSLASHAAIALENASLFEDNRHALVELQYASALVAEQNDLLERAAALHETLTRLVLDGAPLEALAHAVAASIGGSVTVLDAGGTPLASTGDSRKLLPRILEEASSSGCPMRYVAETGSHVTVVAARTERRRLGFLVHVGEELSPAGMRAIERTAMVTALLLLDRRAHEEARARAVADLMLFLISHSNPDLSLLKSRAQAARVSLPEAPHVAVVGLVQEDEEGSQSLFTTVMNVALREGWLACVEGRRIMVIASSMEAGPTGREVADRLSEATGVLVTVGSAPTPDGLGAVKESLARALRCAQVLEMTGRVGGHATPEDLGNYTLLLSEVSRERVEEFVEETIGDVRRWDAERNGNLLSTMEAFFEVGSQTGKLADALFIHVNTLYQRLERLDRILGNGWRRGEQALQVHLAVRLLGLLSATHVKTPNQQTW